MDQGTGGNKQHLLNERLTLVLYLPAGASAADLHGKVVGVADGDTVTVQVAFAMYRLNHRPR